MKQATNSRDRLWALGTDSCPSVGRSSTKSNWSPWSTRVRRAREAVAARERRAGGGRLPSAAWHVGRGRRRRAHVTAPRHHADPDRSRRARAGGKTADPRSRVLRTARATGPCPPACAGRRSRGTIQSGVCRGRAAGRRPLYIEASRTGGFTFRSSGCRRRLGPDDPRSGIGPGDGRQLVASVSAVGAPVVTAARRLCRGAGSSLRMAVWPNSRPREPVPSPHDRCRSTAPTNMCLSILANAAFRFSSEAPGSSKARCTSIGWRPPKSNRSNHTVFQTLLPTSDLTVADANPLRMSCMDFVDSIQRGQRPRVDGVHAARAVWLAERIVGQIQAGAPRPVRTSGASCRLSERAARQVRSRESRNRLPRRREPTRSAV